MDWMILLLGIVAIAWVNWYFFIAGRGVTTTSASSVDSSRLTFGGDAMPEATITVHGGYYPRTVLAKAGQPVHLVFDRQESSSCSEEVVFADFGIRKFLPLACVFTLPRLALRGACSCHTQTHSDAHFNLLRSSDDRPYQYAKRSP